MTPHDKAVAINADPRFKRIRHQAQSVMDSQAPPARKVILLAKIANEFTETIRAHVPCRRGCSSCCNQAVGITESEARVLESASGRTMAKLDRTLEEMDAALHDMATKYYNVPCPFLKGTECSVYEARPMACRMHHSLQETANPCRTDVGEAHDAPIVAMLSFEREMVLAVGILSIHEQMGSIHEFFPPDPAHSDQPPEPQQGSLP